MTKDGKIAPYDTTRFSRPRGGSIETPNPGTVPPGGNSVLPAIDANAGGPAKGSPATIGKPGGGTKSFRVSGG